MHLISILSHQSDLSKVARKTNLTMALPWLKPCSNTAAYIVHLECLCKWGLSNSGFYYFFSLLSCHFLLSCFLLQSCWANWSSNICHVVHHPGISCTLCLECSSSPRPLSEQLLSKSFPTTSAQVKLIMPCPLGCSRLYCMWFIIREVLLGLWWLVCMVTSSTSLWALWVKSLFYSFLQHQHNT